MTTDSAVILRDVATGSQAWTEPDGPSWTVHQHGPLQLWDQVEDALLLWQNAGVPALTEFGMTAAPLRTGRVDRLANGTELAVTRLIRVQGALNLERRDCLSSKSRKATAVSVPLLSSLWPPAPGAVSRPARRGGRSRAHADHATPALRPLGTPGHLPRSRLPQEGGCAAAPLRGAGCSARGRGRRRRGPAAGGDRSAVLCLCRVFARSSTSSPAPGIRAQDIHRPRATYRPRRRSESGPRLEAAALRGARTERERQSRRGPYRSVPLRPCIRCFSVAAPGGCTQQLRAPHTCVFRVHGRRQPVGAAEELTGMIREGRGVHIHIVHALRNDPGRSWGRVPSASAAHCHPCAGRMPSRGINSARAGRSGGSLSCWSRRPGAARCGVNRTAAASSPDIGTGRAQEEADSVGAVSGVRCVGEPLGRRAPGSLWNWPQLNDSRGVRAWLHACRSPLRQLTFWIRF